jgi:Peptidase family M28
MTPDTTHLREVVETLELIDRPSASDGEREAAEWIRDRFERLGLPARIEPERAHGTYWWPLGAMTAAAGLAGVGRGRRRAAALTGALAAAGIVDDVSGGPHLFRRALPHRTTHNVVAEAGDPDAEQTIVFVAHHDAAHGGLIFAPEFVTIPADLFPAWYEGQETSPPVMRIVAAGPALVALGALTGSRLVRRAGTVVSFGSALAFADIAARAVVPGANDNLTAVAVVLELARLLAADPPAGVRVILLSTGSEESFMEGMRGFARRHFASLPTASTRVICVESVGSPELIVIEGEGMIRMTDYPLESREFLAAAGDDAGVPLRRGLRLGLATDGLIALKAGYPTATLASVTTYKFPANYHSHKDVARNVDFGSVAGAVKVCEAAVRRAAGSASAA